MDEVREKVAKGTAPTCFAKHLLEEQESLGMSDLEIAYTAGSPFGAGVETVSLPFHDENFVAKILAVRGLTCKLSSRLCQVRTSIHPKGPRRAGQSCRE